MDTMRGRFSQDHDAEEEVAVDVLPPALGRDERRMQVHAYNHWASLLGPRDFPAIGQLDLAGLPDFAPCAVLIDFSAGDDAPHLAHIGARLAQQAGIEPAPRPLAQVPAGTLLSRFTDHYAEIFANRAPIGFEADFETPAGTTMLYRGILLPFSQDGSRIDHILGVINWKEQLDAAASEGLLREMRGVMDVAPAPRSGTVGTLAHPATPPGARARRWDWNDQDWTQTGSSLWPLGEDSHDPTDHRPTDHRPTDHWPAAPAPARPAPSLAERLTAAHALAQAARVAPARDHGALYAAIGAAHDLALAADQAPEEAAALLAAHHLAPKPRTPWLPFVKLVFGAGHDKTRLTEYATALAHARDAGLGMGKLAGHLMATPGGLKAVVAAQRLHRRTQAPAPRADALPEVLAQALLSLPAADWADVAPQGSITLAVVRAGAHGVEPLGALATGSAMTERLLRQFLGQLSQGRTAG
jgi:hypothetical protein